MQRAPSERRPCRFALSLDDLAAAVRRRPIIHLYQGYVVGSTPQISAPFWYRVTVCVSLYTKLGSEMNE
jgi:hypothetical protein